LNFFAYNIIVQQSVTFAVHFSVSYANQKLDITYHA